LIDSPDRKDMKDDLFILEEKKQQRRHIKGTTNNEGKSRRKK